MALTVLALSLLFSSFAKAGWPASANISTTRVQHCCSALNQQAVGYVLWPDTDFVKANERWSVTAELYPSCIVQPTDPVGVSHAVEILTTAACPFAIKSGGHTPTPGANDINGGITIDLRYINETTLSADRGSVTLGAGSTWLNAYSNVNGTGVAFPGGRYGLVGVGGLTTGGGLSFFTPKVGWVADNVLNFEVVLASGEIVNANNASNSDLWLALKGGSGNFGIVTRVKIQTFESDGKVWGGSVVYPHTGNTTSQVLSALKNFTANNYLDPDAAFNSNFIYDTSTGTKEIANTIVYAKDVANRSIFDEVQSIQPQLENSAESSTIIELAADTSSLPYGYRYLGATITFQNSLKALTTAQRITDAAFETVSNVTDLRFTFVYEPVPRLYNEHSIARGGNVLGLDDKADKILLLLVPRWTDPQYDSRLTEVFESWAAQMEKEMTAIGAHEDFTYLNYAASFQDPLANYGEANIQIMKRVATKYDPKGVFQTLVPGGFKISKV